MSLSATLARLVDDAAIFPPGSAPLPEAVAAHLRHRRAPYAELVGPLVLSAAALEALPDVWAELRTHEPDQSSTTDAAAESAGAATLDLSVTVPSPAVLSGVMARVATLPGVRLVALEIAVPADLAARDVVPSVDAALATHAGLARGPADVQAYVEVPRDDRRPELLQALADSGHRAKFRTGGVEAHLYPDEAELARAIALAAELGLPFKATAGLHHAIRNTDPSTGFEQHGFLNVLRATEAALRGAAADDLARILADRDGPSVAAAIAAWPPEVAVVTRGAFVSFGSCSVTDPLTELVGLGLVPADLRVSPDDQGASR